MYILAIDTSCDETSIAISSDDCLLANVLSSQIQAHKEWGGVVPSLAKRKHEELFSLVLNRALKQAKVGIDKIDVFAVTRGPGLAIALEVGIRKAKELSEKYKKPLIPINHMEGHLYSAFARNSKGKPVIDYRFPLLVLLISGGHTEFVLMLNHGQYEIIGRTQDDAIGESFDKVGRILDFGYPAGPTLEKVAEKGNENAYELPIPMKSSKDLNMSYSGLKTAAMKLVNDKLGAINEYGEKFKQSLQTSKSLNHDTAKSIFSVIGINSKINQSNSNIIADISASFQKAAVDQVLIKTKYALQKLESDGLTINDLVIAGGVAQNKYLRRKFRIEFAKLNIHYPKSKKLYTDNAGMIAVAGFYNAIGGKALTDRHQINRVDRDPNWRIDEI